MLYLSQWKLFIVAAAIITAITYAEYGAREVADLESLAGGKVISDEASNLSRVKKLQSLSYWENPYKATTGYPD